MPTITDNVIIPTKGWWVRVHLPTGTEQQVAYYPNTDVRSHASKIVRPDRRGKPTGWLYPTPYERSGSTTRQEFQVCEWTQHARVDNKNNVPAYRNMILNSIAPRWSGRQLPTITQNMRNKALTNALSKLKSQNVNFGVALGEARETSRFVGESFTAIGSSIRSLKRGNPREMINTLKRHRNRWRKKMRSPHVREATLRKIPQNWLKWQYAAKPLINDVNGSLTELAGYDAPSWVTTVKGYQGFERSGLHDSGDTDLGVYRSLIEWDEEAGTLVRLDYQPDVEFLSRLSSLGVTNPLEVAWELVPFSFVLDWAVGVGDWLSSLDAALGWKFHSGSRSEFRAIREVSKPRPGPLNWRPFYTWEPSNVKRRWVTVRRRFDTRRVVLTSTPIPGIVYENPFSLGHVANGLALLATIIRR